jgi:L-fucose isomerase-like protein
MTADAPAPWDRPAAVGVVGIARLTPAAAVKEALDTLVVQLEEAGVSVPFVEIGATAGDISIADGADALLIYLAEWTAEDTAPMLVANGRLPVVVWGDDLRRQGPPYAALSGVFSSAAELARRGIDRLGVCADTGDAQAVREATDWLKAHVAARRLGSTRILRIGTACPGMLGTEPPRALIDALPFETIDTPVAQFIERCAARNGDAAELFGGRRDPAVTDDEVARSSAIAAVLQDEAHSRGASAVALRCWPEVREELRTAPCAALGALARQGVVGVCEADVLSAAAMVVLRWLSGSDPFLGDFGDVDRGRGAFRLWHCGSAPASLAVGDAVLARHTLGNVGTTLRFPVRTGEATVVGMAFGAGDRLRVLVASAEAIDAPAELPGNNMMLRPRPTVRDFVSVALREGFGHHFIAVHGDVAASFAEAWGLLGADVIRVGA